MRAYEFVNKHIAQGRKFYVICSMIYKIDNELENVLEYTQNIQRRFPGLTIRPLHGKMKPAEKESIMQEFSKNEIDILVSTVVIEVGVDVPNAVIMLIENAERYGLSQLHQLRGRVGRGKHKSTCILITPSKDVDTLDRLKAFASTSDGFKISEMDLKMRGPGDFFGNRQHGLPAMKIADLTSDMDLLYQAQNCAGRIINGEFKEEDVVDMVMSTKRLFSRSDEYKEVSIVL